MTTDDRTTEASLDEVRVLVLDDEEGIRRIAQRILARQGCYVQCVEDGGEGLQALLKEKFDVLVVDLRMRGMDGLTFLDEALKIWPWLGIVIMTGYADEESVQRAHVMGIHRFLEKPVAPKDLVDAVQAAATEKRERVELPRAMEQAQYQLDMLRRIGETAVGNENLGEALRNLSHGLGRVLPASVIGILIHEAETPTLMLSLRESVSEAFIEHMKRDMLDRYEALSGRPLEHDAVHVRVEGKPLHEAEDAVRSTFTVPVIIGGTLEGLLTLAAPEPDRFSTTDISFLYHAANQLSTVLVALNRMRQLAIRDALTGLYNRRHLEEQLDLVFHAAKRYEHDMSVAVIDLDLFKAINDEHGHLAGDQLLREFAEHLLTLSRASDIVGRYGGDEMVVILPKAGESDARAFAARVVDFVNGHVFCPDDLRLAITVSVGVANRCNARRPKTALELLGQADDALFRAKRQGRNQAAVWTPESDRTRRGGNRAPRPLSPSPEPPLRKRPGILVVDDDENILKMIHTVLAGEPYDVTTELAGAPALARIRERPGDFDVVMTDIHLVGESGLDLLKQVETMDPSIVKIVFTGQVTVDAAVSSMRGGAYDFVEKPLMPEQVRFVIRRAMEYRRLVQENARYHLYLEDMVEQKSAALAQTLEQLKQSYEFTLEAMVAMLDAREHGTGQHSLRVRDAALVLARSLELSPSDFEQIGRGALLHDIGKIAVPDAILLKRGPLDDEEWQIMRRHPEIGYNILRAAPILLGAAEIVLSHQERWDGSGYPRRLERKDICLGARVFAVVDAYDAMRSTRPYRKNYSAKRALEEIQRGAGSQFDPDIVAAFVSCRDQIEKAAQYDA